MLVFNANEVIGSSQPHVLQMRVSVSFIDCSVVFTLPRPHVIDDQFDGLPVEDKSPYSSPVDLGRLVQQSLECSGATLAVE